MSQAIKHNPKKPNRFLLVAALTAFVVLGAVATFLLVAQNKPEQQATPTESGKLDEPPAAEILNSATPSPNPISSATPSPTFAFTPTTTPEGLFYANHFEGAGAGLDDWIVHSLPYTLRHDNDNKPYTFAKPDQRKLVMDTSDGQPLYAIYDFRLPTVDTILSTEMEFVGEGSASFSMVCRYSEAGWYELGINNRSSWWIRMSNSDGSTEIQHTDLLANKSAVIDPGVNELEASCSGNVLSLTVNGQLLGSVEHGALNENGIVGLVYQEDSITEISVEIGTLKITDPNGREYMNRVFQKDAPFYTWEFAGSLGAPAEVYALVVPNADVEVESGRGRITANRKMGWIALYPGELPYNVEIAVDVDLERFDYDQGFGLVCRWWDQPAVYADQGTGGYVLRILKTYVIVTPFYINEGGVVNGRGTAEFSNTSFVDLLEGTEHHLMARCWNELVEFYVDGELVARHKTTDFPYAGNTKSGSMVGLMFVAREAGSAGWIDNLMISWDLAPTNTSTP